MDSKQAFVSGAIWAISMRWSIKAIGFLNTVIMARLLVPADYGVVAMATLVVGLVQAFLEMGTDIALLRKNQVSRDEVDSAWTLRIIQGVLVAVLVALLSVPAELYFKEPRVTPMLWVLAACVALGGLQNVGLVLAQKALEFRLIFKHAVICKGLSVVATIVAGAVLGDYRALLVGLATGYVAATVLSFWMHPYRPRWNTSEMATVWAVSKWLMLSQMGGYLLGKVDELVAARIGTTAQFGMYNVGADLGTLPVASIGPAVLQSMLPVLARLENQPERTNAAVTKTIGALNTVTFPVGIGFAALAVPVTALVLGPQWSDAALFVALFAVRGSLSFLLNPLFALMVMRGFANMTTRVAWIELVAFCAAAALLAPAYSLTGLAAARLFSILVTTATVALAARKHCGIHLRGIALVLARPVGGAILMAGVIELVLQWVELPALQVLTGVLCGGGFFAAWSFLTWHVAGRPDGFESTLLDMLPSRKTS